MGERDEFRRRERRKYQDYVTTAPGPQPGRRRLPTWRSALGLLERVWHRRKLRRLVSAPLAGPPGGWGPGGDGGDGDTGGAGVREPRRPLPRSPQGAADLPRD